MFRIVVDWIVVGVVLRSVSIACGTSVTNFSDVLCGKQSNRSPKIVGGHTASIGEFPWIVSLKERTNHICGGVVVNKNWVITAAHCFCSGSSFQDKRRYSVSVSRDGFRNSSSADIEIEKITVHPQYSCKKLENDLALMELKIGISWIDADPACFPAAGVSKFTTLDNVPAVAVGWGATNEDLSIGAFPEMLHKVEVPILQNSECQRWYKSENKTLNLRKSQMCAGYKGGEKDACWADSGGPLMVRHEGNMVVVGIVSTGIGCARASLPGIYTRMTEYINWITNVVS